MTILERIYLGRLGDSLRRRAATEPGKGGDRMDQPGAAADLPAPPMTPGEQVTTAAGCPATVHETVCVQADVTLTPVVTVGTVRSFCVGPPIIGPCVGPTSPSGTCTFTVSQQICVQVPLTFSASATAVPTGIVCGTPQPGPCSPSIGCTHSMGYFKTHLDVTNSLITGAGGAIVLGVDGNGLSFTVTTSTAANVLSFSTPSPPAPSSPPFSNQYQVLYAQLLAAQLNVLSGAACPFAAAAIAAANMFLAESPPGGIAGAPAVQEPLAAFNEGRAPGCPAHCPE